MTDPGAGQPYFTVGVPTLNRGASFLPATLQAILGQSFADFELLVSDNASTDSTEELLRSYRDPRLRFVRRPARLEAAAHFSTLAREARGRFFVLNQDDDLLHRDFLRRAHDALSAHADAVMYAAPVWRQSPNRGYLARAMRPAEGYADAQVIADEVYRIDGRYAAAHLLDPLLQFLHPTVAIDSACMGRTGGYDGTAGQSADLVTQARVLLRGVLLYDPRPGGVFRVHRENVSRTMKRATRKSYYRQTYAALLRTFEEGGVDWRAAIGGYLGALQDRDAMECVQAWVYYGAPVALQDFGLKLIARRWTGSRIALWRKLASRIGVRNLARYAASRAGW